jgi:hypothetical protein
MYSENIIQKFHRVSDVRSMAISLKPGVGDFMFLKWADEMIQHCAPPLGSVPTTQLYKEKIYTE